MGIISNPSFGSTSPPPSLPLRYWEFIQFKNAVSSPSIKVKIFLKLGTFNRIWREVCHIVNKDKVESQNILKDGKNDEIDDDENNLFYLNYDRTINNA